MRHTNERKALKIAAAVLLPRAQRNRERRHCRWYDTGAAIDIRDIAAFACGMVHRSGYLVFRQSLVLQQRGRLAVLDDQKCLINSIESLPEVRQ